MLLTAIFVLGYLAIVFEHTLKVNKAAAALLTGVLCWTAYIVPGDANVITGELLHHLGELSQILFFLLGAMTIVELIDAHDGFELITSRVTTNSRRMLLFTIAVLAFFMSAVLDNLTASIVMMSLVRKLASESEDRMYYGGVVIIAANAGGVWSPIGDVTTTMLWVGGQVTPLKLLTHLFIPSVVSVLVPVLWFALKVKGEVRRSGKRAGGVREPRPSLVDGGLASGATSITLPVDAAAAGKSLVQLDLRARTGALVLSVTRDGKVESLSPTEPLRASDELAMTGSPAALALALEFLLDGQAPQTTTATERSLVLFAGVGVLLFVPVFKTLTHLPPFMGILLGLGILWTLTELVHKGKNDEGRSHLSVAGALQRIDTQSVLFFLGILLAISALQSDGLLTGLAQWLDSTIGNVDVITVAIGLSSAIVDNVPLVAAAQGMYPSSTFPTDHHFWLFLAYCAGTGGSILIIGSAAGIAVMGMERISFGWYLRTMSFPALLGYAAGALAYLILEGMAG